MAWTYFPLSVATLPAKGLQEWGIWQELIDAINERRLARGLTVMANPFPSTAAGYAIASSSALGGLILATQQLITNTSTTMRFVNHTVNGGDFRGEASIPIWNWLGGDSNDIALAAPVGNGTGWTRRYGSDPDALLTAYDDGLSGFSAVSPGDVVGIYREGGVDKISEFLNEIYRVLNLLRWTRKNASHVSGSTGNCGYTTLIAEPTTALAYARLQAEWPGAFSAGIAQEIRHTCEISENAGNYHANGANTRSQWRAITIDTTVQHSAQLYGYCEGFNEFDDDGLGYNNEALSLLETFAEAAVSSRTSSLLGDDISVQNKPTADPGVGATIKRGYRVGTVMRFVFKWDGPSGFTKVS